MKKTAKFLSVALALIMALTVLPFAAFAAEKEDELEAVVNGWNENYGLLEEEVLDNTKYVSWQYVDQNMKAINNTMAAYTAFALYDNAWINYASQTLNVEDAEQILLALIEKADFEFNDGYVDEIISILETAKDVNDFIQKVNDYIPLDFTQTEGWGTAFEVIGDVVKIGNAYQNYRDQFIAAYAKFLSVQMANAYYIDMLQYIVEKNSYSVLTKAAQNLIDDIEKSVNDAIAEIVAKIAEDGASLGTEYLLKLAANSNAYTAVALKVYQTGTSVADFLWNTSDQFALIDTVKTAYYFQSDIAEWTKLALKGEDAEKASIAMRIAITARAVSEEALYNLKLAENEGAINKIKNKLYGTVYNNIEVNLATLDTIKNIMFNTPAEDMKEIKRVLTIYCPVDVELLKNGNAFYTLCDGSEALVSNEYGVFVSVYSEYAKTYHKIAFLYDADMVRLAGKAEGYVTVIMDLLENGVKNDWSFTDVKVNNGKLIVFNTEFKGTPVYTTSDGTSVVKFNDKFVPSEQPEVTVKDVVTATTDVAKEEGKSFLDKIKAFFEDFFAKISAFFSNLF